MSLLQERFSRPLPFRGSLDDRPAEHLLRSEASLLSELFRRNGRESSVQTATPPGYRYEYIVTMPGLAPEESGPVLQVAAHPGDGPDFFMPPVCK